MQLILGVFAVGDHARTRCSQDSTGSANVFMLESTFFKLSNDKGREYELCLSVWYKTFMKLIVCVSTTVFITQGNYVRYMFRLLNSHLQPYSLQV